MGRLQLCARSAAVSDGSSATLSPLRTASSAPHASIHTTQRRGVGEPAEREWRWLGECWCNEAAYGDREGWREEAAVCDEMMGRAARRGRASQKRTQQPMTVCCAVQPLTTAPARTMPCASFMPLCPPSPLLITPTPLQPPLTDRPPCGDAGLASPGSGGWRCSEAPSLRLRWSSSARSVSGHSPMLPSCALHLLLSMC